MCARSRTAPDSLSRAHVVFSPERISKPALVNLLVQHAQITVTSFESAHNAKPVYSRNSPSTRAMPCCAKYGCTAPCAAEWHPSKNDAALFAQVVMTIPTALGHIHTYPGGSLDHRIGTGRLYVRTDYMAANRYPGTHLERFIQLENAAARLQYL